MVNIDTVYQTVLVLANKEQRGYITPQEFNLFANQAQKEIVDQYFYDLNQFSRIHGNDTAYSDMLTLLEEKLDFLKVTGHAISGGSPFSLPTDNYQLGHVVDGVTNNIIDKVTVKQFEELVESPLTIPTTTRPIYYYSGGGTITVSPSGVTSIMISYTKQPTHVNWGYVVINEKALYDPTNTVHFDLHPTEQTELVYKILKLAGISIKRQDLAAAGQSLEAAKIQQEKQ